LSPLIPIALLVLSGCSLSADALPFDSGDAAVSDGGGDAFDTSPPDDAPVDANDDASADTVPPGDTSRPDAGDTGPMDTGPDSPPPPGFCDTTDPDLLACVRFEDALVDDAVPAHPFRGTGHAFDSGRVGRALSHDAGDQVWMESVGDLPDLPFTFEVWMRPSAIPVSGRMGAVDFDGSFGIFVYPGGHVACKSAEEARSTGGATADIWTHVACIFEVDRVRTFLDGVEAASSFSSYGGGSSGADFRFGGNAPSGDDFRGLLDEARFFGDVRTSAEILGAATR